MTKPKQGTYTATMIISPDIRSFVTEDAIRSELRDNLQRKADSLATSRSKYVVVESTERYHEVDDFLSRHMRHAVLKAFISRLTKKGYTYPSPILRLPK